MRAWLSAPFALERCPPDAPFAVPRREASESRRRVSRLSRLQERADPSWTHVRVAHETVRARMGTYAHSVFVDTVRKWGAAGSEHRDFTTKMRLWNDEVGGDDPRVDVEAAFRVGAKFSKTQGTWIGMEEFLVFQCLTMFASFSSGSCEPWRTQNLWFLCWRVWGAAAHATNSVRNKVMLCFAGTLEATITWALNSRHVIARLWWKTLLPPPTQKSRLNRKSCG